METPRHPPGHATAADIAHDERLEVVNGQIVSKDEDDRAETARFRRRHHNPARGCHACSRASAWPRLGNNIGW